MAGNRKASSPFLTAYRWGGRLALPLLSVLYTRRVRRGKEDPKRRGERFGYSDRARPEGALVWVHAASVGETNAVMPLIEWIAGRGLTVLLTTGTLTSAQVAAKRLPAGAIHQYFPYDVVPAIGRFLDHWHPSVAITVESEIWPTMLTSLDARGIATIVVNGRMSEASYRGWQRLRKAAGAVFGSFAMCLAQSERDAERFARLGVGDVRTAGNLKFDVTPPAADAKELANLQQRIGARPVWVAASTHDGEEAAAGRVHATLRADDPELLLICVPRHPERGPAVADLFAEQGFDVALRSRGDGIRPGTSVYVADTIGEMGLFYRLAQVAFIGGSIAQRGGQNPIEPAQLGCAVVTGPSIRNFAKVYEALKEFGGAQVVADEQALGLMLRDLLGDADRRDVAATAARDVVANGQGALTRVIAVLDPILARLVDAGRETGQSLDEGGDHGLRGEAE